jgi:formate hydrogenlyase subunit 3/multisubunit Na+/H+ antiporter MnhD subunit
MAALTGPAVLASGGGSGAPRWAVLSFQKVTAADTFDASTLTSIAPFVTVTAAVFCAESNRTATTTLSTMAGTVITVLGTGIAADAGLLWVFGE